MRSVNDIFIASLLGVALGLGCGPAEAFGLQVVADTPSEAIDQEVREMELLVAQAKVASGAPASTERAAVGPARGAPELQGAGKGRWGLLGETIAQLLPTSELGRGESKDENLGVRGVRGVAGGLADQGVVGEGAIDGKMNVGADIGAGVENDAGGASGEVPVWQQLARPSAAHALLDVFAGTWSVEGKFDTGPGEPPATATGTMTTTWTLGKRWLRQEYSGNMPALGAFAGIGYLGFDNAQQRFISTWMDTLSTSVITSAGTFNDSTGVFTLVGQFAAPGGQMFSQKQVVTVQSRDRYSIVLILVSPDGSESRTGEVRYVRSGGVRTFTSVREGER